MSCVKITYQLFIAVRFLAFIPGLILTILSVLEADDSVDKSFGYIAIGMGGIHVLFMLAFGCRYIQNFGVFLEQSTSCCSLWIYLPEPATIAFLVYFCTLTSGNAKNFAMGAAAAFGLSFLIVFIVICERRVFRKEIPEDSEKLIHGRARNIKPQKQKMRKASHKSSGQKDNYYKQQQRQQQQQEIPESENPYEELRTLRNSVHTRSKRHHAKRPRPPSPKLQDLVGSSSNKTGVTNKDRPRDKRIYGLEDMKVQSIHNSRHSSNPNGVHSIHNSRHSSNPNGDLFFSNGPPLRYSGSYPGSTFYFNGEGPPLGYSSGSVGPYNHSNGQAPSLRPNNNMISDRTGSDYSRRPQFSMYSGNFDRGWY